MDPALVERIRRLYDVAGFAAGVPAFLELAHPDIELVPAGGWVDMARTIHGHDGARAYFEGLEEVFGTLRYELVELEDHGDALVTEVRVHAEGRESGVATSTPIFQVMWMEDGLIRRIEGYANRETAVAALERSGQD
jgi:ketosteroid isomerase-like protein